MTDQPDDTTMGDTEAIQPDDIDEDASGDPQPMAAGETDPEAEPAAGTEPQP